jgi:hypothetical protein
MITGIVAEPGNGKSAFSLWLARTIVTACMWFTGLRALPKPARVLWCGTENDLAITLDRMRKWGIPEHGIILPFKDDPLRPIVLTDDSHLERIESLVNRYKTPAVFIDSLRGGHDGDENNSQVGRVLQSLSAIAQRTGAAFIVVHHTRKLSVDEEVTANSSRGSNAILALMRSQIGIDRPDPESPWRRARVLKENLGLAPKPVGFRITDKGLEFGPAPEKPKKDTRKQDAVDWLKANMPPNAWNPAKAMVTQAKQAGFSDNALQRAREELGITTATGCVRQRADGCYEWRMPGVPGSRPSASDRGYDSEWRDFRKSYARAVPPVCVDCGHAGESDEMDLDHIVPIQDGGAKYHPDNLAWRCGQRSGNGCHRRKTARQAAERNNPKP